MHKIQNNSTFKQIFDQPIEDSNSNEMEKIQENSNFEEILAQHSDDSTFEQIVDQHNDDSIFEQIVDQTIEDSNSKNGQQNHNDSKENYKIFNNNSLKVLNLENDPIRKPFTIIDTENNNNNNFEDKNPENDKICYNFVEESDRLKQSENKQINNNGSLENLHLIEMKTDNLNLRVERKTDQTIEIPNFSELKKMDFVENRPEEETCQICHLKLQKKSDLIRHLYSSHI